MSTVGLDLKSKVVTACGKRIKCDVWDTAGQDRYRSITKSYYRKADGVMLPGRRSWNFSERGELGRVDRGRGTRPECDQGARRLCL